MRPELQADDTHQKNVLSPESISSPSPQSHDLADLKNQMLKLTDAVKQIKPNVNTVTNNVNMYFNNDLKYYPELIKILGREHTQNLLLFKMPESRDTFCVLEKLYYQNGVSTCPIRVDGNTFIVPRSQTKFDTDLTGEIIDRENKYKLRDAIISAYIDSTKHLQDKCETIRQTRINDEYTSEDIDIMNQRFEYNIEPSRPFQVIDIINSIKPRKKDFDRLRKICQPIVKEHVF